jgi:hypothetical protein
MPTIVESVTGAINQAANEIIDNQVTTKLSETIASGVSTSFAIVDDVLKIIRDATADRS